MSEKQKPVWLVCEAEEESWIDSEAEAIDAAKEKARETGSVHLVLRSVACIVPSVVVETIDPNPPKPRKRRERKANGVPPLEDDKLTHTGGSPIAEHPDLGDLEGNGVGFLRR